MIKHGLLGDSDMHGTGMLFFFNTLINHSHQPTPVFLKAKIFCSSQKDHGCLLPRKPYIYFTINSKVKHTENFCKHLPCAFMYSERGKKQHLEFNTEV